MEGAVKKSSKMLFKMKVAVNPCDPVILLLQRACCSEPDWTQVLYAIYIIIYMLIS